jgi:glucose/mannose-6-phosphate isomerase
VPITISKDYELPGFVGERTLVFALSFSGNSEEVVEGVTEAAALGAHVVMVCECGELARLAADWGRPMLPIPAGIPMPRAGLGALAVPPLLALEHIGLFPGARGWVQAAIDQLSRRRDQLAAAGNPADALARRIGRTIPLVYGGGPIGGVAAMRWKYDVNENAKAPAFYNRVPELCHNEVAGWGQHGDVTRQVLTIVDLRHDHEHPHLARRFELMSSLEDEVVASIEEVHAEGDGPLAQLFDLILFGDVMSLAMADHAGVDHRSLRSTSSSNRSRLQTRRRDHHRRSAPARISRRDSTGALRPQGDPPAEHVMPGRALRAELGSDAAAGARISGSLHDRPDRGAHRDARRARSRGAVGVVQHLRPAMPPPGRSGRTARPTTLRASPSSPGRGVAREYWWHHRCPRGPAVTART